CRRRRVDHVRIRELRQPIAGTERRTERRRIGSRSRGSVHRGLRTGSSREFAPRALQLATAPEAREGPREVLVVFWRNLLAFSEGLRPSDSPTGSLARRFAGSLRSPGSLASWNARPTFVRYVLVFSEGLRPSDSPTGSLARRFAGSLRSPGSLAVLARVVEREADVCEIRSSLILGVVSCD